MWVWCVAAFAGGKQEKAELFAEQSMMAHDPVTALQLASKALKKDGDNARANLAFARALMNLQGSVQGLGDEAQLIVAAALQRAADLDPNGLVGAIARDYLNPAREQIPQPECSPEAVAAYNDAERAFAGGDRTGAQAAYARALAQCDANPVWWVYAGDAYFPDDLPAALQRYQAGIDRAPCHWQGYRFKGDALMHLEAYPDAHAALVRSVACNPTYAAAWTSAADLTRSLGGRPVSSAPFRLPLSSHEAGERGPGWAAWWAHRQGHPVETLADAVAAARAGLAAGPPQDEWAVLAALEGKGALDLGVLYLLFEPALRDDLQGYQASDREALFTFVGTHLLAVP